MAYLDGELSAERAAEAMTHLERCGDCQKLAEDLRRVSQEMAGWQVEAPREMAAEPVAEATRRKWRLFRRRAYLFAVPAVCAGLGLLAIFVSVNMNDRPANFARFKSQRQTGR